VVVVVVMMNNFYRRCAIGGGGGGEMQWRQRYKDTGVLWRSVVAKNSNNKSVAL
jgi:hypothetical protein